MKKACETCVFFRSGDRDSWCTLGHDGNPEFDWDESTKPSEAWCSEWRSMKKWGEIYKRNDEIQELKAMMRRIASLLAIGSEKALGHAAGIAKQYGGKP